MEVLDRAGVKYLIKKISEKFSGSLKKVTYDELKTLRDNSQLTPGQQYRITDYVTTTSQENTQSAGHQFDLIVTADDEKTLNEKARAIQHEGDTYFANSDLNAWEVWYCLDDDTDRFAWALNGNEYKVINYHGPAGLKETRFTINDTNKIVTSCKTGKQAYVIYEERTYGNFDYIVDIDSLSESPIKAYANTTEGQVSSAYFDMKKLNMGVIYRMIDEFGNDCPYDFKNIQFKHPNDTTTYPDYYYTFSTVINGVVTDHSMLQGCCYGNTIKEYITSKPQKLNNNVFLYTSKNYSCHSNSFGNNCYSNSFGNSCNSNTFGSSCYSNSFGNDFNSNTVGNSCHDNSFGSSCSNNFFGNSCNNNSFGNYFRNNSFGNSSSNNTFGDKCQNNSFENGSGSITFGNECSSNSFGHNSGNNTFGDKCQNNSFGNYCNHNTFGGYCGYNSFGNYFRNNSFGTSCYYNSFGNYCTCNSFRVSADISSSLKDYVRCNHFDDTCSYNVIWNSDTTNGDVLLKNINVNRGVSGTSSSYNYINITTLNQDYEIQVAKNSKGEIKIYCEADLIA